MNVALANRMCNFAMEVDVPNYKGLNQLCRACWLLDHDMFEVGVIILFAWNFFSYFFFFIYRKLWKYFQVIINGLC